MNGHTPGDHFGKMTSEKNPTSAVVRATLGTYVKETVLNTSSNRTNLNIIIEISNRLVLLRNMYSASSFQAIISTSYINGSFPKVVILLTDSK